MYVYRLYARVHRLQGQGRNTVHTGTLSGSAQRVCLARDAPPFALIAAPPHVYCRLATHHSASPLSVYGQEGS